MRSMLSRYNRGNQNQGFTLIELAIVLVIIGLIVGGVLVGQDLIKAAEIRAAVTQLEQYNTAANTFRTKYNGFPGDLRNAANFQFATTGRVSDGNGIIACTAGDCGSATGIGGEAAYFFEDLQTAGFTGDTINVTSGTAAAVNAASLADVLPTSKMGSGNYVAISTTGGLNFYLLGAVTAISTAGVATAANGLTPTQAFQIDSKFDDGLPSTGNTQSSNGAWATSLVALDGQDTAVAGDCIDTNGTAGTASDDVYATNAAAAANVSGCVLRIRASI